MKKRNVMFHSWSLKLPGDLTVTVDALRNVWRIEDCAWKGMRVTGGLET